MFNPKDNSMPLCFTFLPKDKPFPGILLPCAANTSSF